MEPHPNLDSRLAFSLRLKAARFLAGGMATDGKRAVALPMSALAARLAEQRNAIAQDRLERFEQMRDDVRDMEIAAIAQALDVPAGLLNGELEAEWRLAPPGELGRRASGSPTSDPLPGQGSTQEGQDHEQGAG